MKCYDSKFIHTGDKLCIVKYVDTCKKVGMVKFVDNGN